jgi:hypothetical protein
MRDLEVRDGSRKLAWRGRPECVQFEVTVPADFPQRFIIGRVPVSQDAVPIGEVRFTLKVVTAARRATDTAGPSGHACRYQKAFISYAAAARPKVQARVQMLEAVGIEYFQDLLHLDPGERWQRALYRHIDTSDVMFLFWSSAAKRSRWVEREWRYALANRGDEFITPVPIEGPPVPSPPAELAHLHFSVIGHSKPASSGHLKTSHLEGGVLPTIISPEGRSGWQTGSRWRLSTRFSVC